MRLIAQSVLRKSGGTSGKFKIYSARNIFCYSTTMDIAATPAIDQIIEYQGKRYSTVKEGLAYILVPADNSKVPQQSPLESSEPQDVFYNPIQQFNRDLSVLAIKAYGQQVVELQKKKLKQSGSKKSNRGKDTEINLPKRLCMPDITLENLDTATEKSNTILPTEEQSSLPNKPLTEVAAEQHKISSVPISSIPPVDDNCYLEEKIEDIKSVENIKTSNYVPNFTILDALSATGLRALRYAHEIPFVTSITANDLLPSATKQIKLNILHNKLTSKIIATNGNAISHMYNLIESTLPSNFGTKSSKYSVIDLDPYGTASPFLDAAVQALQDGGLLCVTCTDAAVWASNGWPEKCFALYGGLPLKGPLSHEAGLRLILHAIATSAARYGLAITPLLSLSIDFYARIFVRVHRSAQHVKFLAGKTMIVYNCDVGCGAWSTQMLGRNRFATTKKGNEMWKHGLEQGPSANQNCTECGFKTHIGGPMYAGPLHNPEFIRRILDGLKDVDEEIYQTIPRIQGMLTVALEECLTENHRNGDQVNSIDSQKNKTSTPLDSVDETHTMTDHASIDPAPFLFMLPALSKVLHTVTPHENAIRGALRHLGYRATRSHTKGGCIKTDAPWKVIWRIMRAWTQERAPIKEGAIRENTAGWKILGLGLSEEEKRKRNLEEAEAYPRPKTDGLLPDSDLKNIVFDEKLGSDKDRNGLVRYQRNPRENWGPMARAKGKIK
ncbi:tRNA -dimethyltransferase [Erysiphe neolycopersici]|uniref:tRNA (guanine(26)-N(2))-dimethyltransferase n=1 Tax=Erysiphe neolycopersici TaxID=212602 RepID=A0A420HAJ2_9PEZI|nr:tRNA -dimethyltransferase [Erysiphe neolycopersici]